MYGGTADPAGEVIGNTSMKAFAWYALAVLAVIAAIGLAAAAFSSDASRRAIAASAVLAVVVQLAAFAVARGFRRSNVMLGWGLGSIIRLLALVCYALIVGRLWRAHPPPPLPLTPALLSFVGFLFATTVIEPLFLTR